MIHILYFLYINVPTFKLLQLFTDYWLRNFYESIDFEIKSQVPLYIYEFGYHGRFNVIEKITLKDHLVSSKN